MKRLVLIDGHAILHRAYYAFPDSIKTRRGELVNAVYGFTRILLSVLDELHPEYVAVAFDLPEPTFRHKEYVGYQIQRPKMDEELKEQIERVFQVVRALNIPIFAVSGYEADDVIGTLAKQAVKKKTEAIIVSGDKDMIQLVNKRVKIYAPQKGLAGGRFFDCQKVKNELGILPEQVVDYKGLIGDSSDNYPGVPGIGPKTASQLLAEYQDLDTIYKNISKLKPIIAQKLKEGKESAILSQKLAKIVTNVPIKLDLKACQIHDYDQEKAIKLFQELEFKSLIDKLPGMEEKRAKAENKNKQMELL